MFDSYFLSREKVPKSARGNRKNGDSPGPPRTLLELYERLFCLAALVAEERLNFRLTRKRSSAKSPLGISCLLRDSRVGVVGTEDWGGEMGQSC